MSEVKIYHNPACATSRNTLTMIRDAGIEPEVVEYLKTPLNHAELAALIAQMGITPNDLLRAKGKLYDALGLATAKLSDDALIDKIVEHPILMNRPIVVTLKGARLCRPKELVLDIL